MHRILIPIDSQDPDSLAYAFEYAKKIFEVHKKGAKVVLLVHTKAQMSSTSLAGHLGSPLAKTLSKGKTAQLQPGQHVQLQTLKTLGQMLSDTIVIGFYADEQMLDLIDDRKSLIGAIAVPDLKGDADVWAARWGAIIHGEKKTSPAKLIGDQVVENALTQLFAMVNPSTGIAHPRDKEHADNVLRILRAKGHTLEAEAIRSFAIQKGWRSRNAADLAKLASKIASLKNKPSLAKIYNPQDRYKSWSS